MGKENHRLLRYDEPPRSGFVQLVSLLPPNRQYIPILKFFSPQENLPQYPLVPRILSSFLFSQRPPVWPYIPISARGISK